MKHRKLLLLPALTLVASGLSGCALLGEVTWRNWDGSIIEVDRDVFFGEKPEFNGIGPNRPSTAQYDYKFIGWDKPVKKMWSLRDEYIAQYESSIRSYTVTWKDLGDFGELKTETLKYGETPSYFTPSISSTAQYNYVFNGWDRKIEAVTCDTTYTTTIQKVVRSYNVEFVDWDGTVLSSYELEYGKTPTAPTNVQRDPDNQYVYSFREWDKPIVPVTKNARYVAQYDKRQRLQFYFTYFVDGVVLPYGKLQPWAFEHTKLELPSLYEEHIDIEWFLTADFSVPVSEVSDVFDNMIFYGRTLGEHEFNISYVVDSSATVDLSKYPSKVTYVQDIDLNEIAALHGPDLEGYYFLGWFDENNQKVTHLLDTLSDMTLTAKFEARTYYITFDYEEYFAPVEAVYNSSSYLSHLPTVNKKWYTFGGWSLSGQAPKLSGKYLYTDDIEVKPILSPTQYGLSYNLDGGALPNRPTYYTVETFANEIPSPTKAGYTFNYWTFKVNDHTYRINPGQSLQDACPNLFTGELAKALTLTAHYTGNMHVVSYNYDGGVPLYKLNFRDGDVILKADQIAYDFSKSGFYPLADKADKQFAGWEDDFGNLVLDDFAISSDTNLNARWNDIHTHPVYDANDPFTVTYEYNDTIAINGGQYVILHNYNGKYLQFTSLVNQELHIETSGSFDVLVTHPDDSLTYVVNGANQQANFHAQAGYSYVIKVFGTGNVDGSTTVEVTSIDPTVSTTPDFVVSAESPSAPENRACSFGDTLPGDGFIPLAKDGYAFDCWKINGNKYGPGDKLDIDADVTLVACWKAL